MVSGLKTGQRLYMKELDVIIDVLHKECREPGSLKATEWDYPAAGHDCTILQFAEATLAALEQVKLRCRNADELLYVEKVAANVSENISCLQQNLHQSQGILLANTLNMPLLLEQFPSKVCPTMHDHRNRQRAQENTCSSWPDGIKNSQKKTTITQTRCQQSRKVRRHEIKQKIKRDSNKHSNADLIRCWPIIKKQSIRKQGSRFHRISRLSHTNPYCGSLK